MTDDDDARDAGAAAPEAPGAPQQETLAFLRDPQSHGGVTPQTRETHISHVFLAGAVVYKLKKAVRFPFLDFSTIALREHFCRLELAVNRTFAPNLYLGLRPILRKEDGALGFGPLMSRPDQRLPEGMAPAVDWVVTMRRFDPYSEFDQMVSDGRLSAATMRELADRVAKGHRAAQVFRNKGGAKAMASVIEEVREALVENGDPALIRKSAAWAEQAAAALAPVAGRLEARRRHGLVRRCHGDLHLGNICLLDGAPTPFDAIEFDEDIAVIDPLYDVAFTAMDLLHRRQGALETAFISRYLSAMRDYSGLVAWPLFLSLRAAIRAMTSALAGDKARSRDLFDFAVRLLEPRPTPILVATAGLSGSGKSTLARALAPRIGGLGAIMISSDVTRKRLFGQRPEARLGDCAYRPEASARVYRRMRVDARRALTAGASVVLDGVFDRPAARKAAADLAAEMGLRFCGLWLNAPVATRLDRVEYRARQVEGDPSDADGAIAAAQRADFDPSEPGWSALAAGGAAEECLDAALARLGLPPR